MCAPCFGWIVYRTGGIATNQDEGEEEWCDEEDILSAFPEAVRDYKQKLRARGRNAENTGGWIRDEESGHVGRRPKQTKERWGEFDRELRAKQEARSRHHERSPWPEDSRLTIAALNH